MLLPAVQSMILCSLFLTLVAADLLAPSLLSRIRWALMYLTQQGCCLASSALLPSTLLAACMYSTHACPLLLQFDFNGYEAECQLQASYSIAAPANQGFQESLTTACWLWVAMQKPAVELCKFCVSLRQQVQPGVSISRRQDWCDVVVMRHSTS